MAPSSPNGIDQRARMPRMPRTVITFGTFDVFHVGHLRVLERAAALGDRLVVGVSADALNERKKGRAPIFSQGERLAIVGALQRRRRGLRRGEPGAEARLHRRARRRRAGDGRRLGGQVRRVQRRVRGRLPRAHSRHLHDRDHRAHRRSLSVPVPGVTRRWVRVLTDRACTDHEGNHAHDDRHRCCWPWHCWALRRSPCPPSPPTRPTDRSGLPPASRRREAPRAAPRGARCPRSASRRPSETLATARRVMTGNALPRDPLRHPGPARPVARRSPSCAARTRRQAERDAGPSRPTAPATRTGFGYTVPEQPPAVQHATVPPLRRHRPRRTAPPEWAAQSLAVMDSVWTQRGRHSSATAPRSPTAPRAAARFRRLPQGPRRRPLRLLRRRDAGQDAHRLRLLRARQRLRRGPVPDRHARGQPAGHRGPRVLPRHPVRLRLRRGPLDDGVDRDLDGGAIATDVNDNRQYLPWSQLGGPYLPLDLFSRKGGYQYGNWIFWEYLTTNYGNDIVNKVWKQAGSLKSDGGKYSSRRSRRCSRARAA